MRFRHVLVVAAPGAGLLLAGCAQPDSDSSSQFANGDVDRPEALTVVDPAEHEPAPVLEGDDLNGNQLSSERYDGQVLVVNLWGSWGGPCRDEAPALRRAAQQLARFDVQFLGITTRIDPAQDRAFVARYRLDYPSIQSPDGPVELGFADTLPAVAVPTTWIIDAAGRVAVRIADTVTAPLLTGLVNEIRKES